MGQERHLRKILENVESDLNVLKASLHNSNHSLPGGVEIALQRAEERLQDAQRHSRQTNKHLHNPVQERMDQEKEAQLLLHPEEDLDRVRSILHSRYQVPLPSSPRRRQRAPPIKGSRLRSPSHPTSQVDAHQGSKRTDEGNPSVPKQSISPPPQRSSRSNNLMEMINRRVIPPNMDLTHALDGDGGIMTASRIKLRKEGNRGKGAWNKSIPATMHDYVNTNGSRNDAGNDGGGMASLPHVQLDPTMGYRKGEKKKDDNRNRTRIPHGYHAVPTQTMGVSTPDLQTSAGIEGYGSSRGNDSVREYEDMLDEHSLHRVVVVQGRLLDSTPEYQSFRRSYPSLWPRITNILLSFVDWIRQMHIPVAHISGKQLALVARESISGVSVTRRRLLACLENEEEVRQQLRRPLHYRGEEGESMAAQVIQKMWRGHAARRETGPILRNGRAVRIIQKYWRASYAFRQIRIRIGETMQKDEERWRETMAHFKKEWRNIKHQRRVVLHVPSLDLRAETAKAFDDHYGPLQNMQLGRVCDAIDENVTVAYVAPFHVGKDAVSYYTRMARSQTGSDISSRVRMLCPDAVRSLPDSFSLASCLSGSFRTLRTLRSITQQKPSYIIPGRVGPQDLRLFSSLNIPVLGPDPTSAAIYSSKSGGCRIFQAASVNTPTCVTDLYSLNDLLLGLARLLSDNPRVLRWLIKIDDDAFSHGTAVLDTRRVGCLSREAQKSLVRKLRESENESAFRIALRDKVYFELRTTLHSVLSIPPFYPSWQSYIRGVEQSGALVQAEPLNIVGRPCLHLLVEPDGVVTVDGVVENYIGGPLHTTRMASGYPHRDPDLVPERALKDAGEAIGSVLYGKDVMGYVSVDFVAFRNSGNHISHDDGSGSRGGDGEDGSASITLWAVDLDIGLTGGALGHRLVHFLTWSSNERADGSSMNYTNNAHTIYYKDNNDINDNNIRDNHSDDEIQTHRCRRAYIHPAPLQHTYLSLLKQEGFFRKCRSASLTYDLHTQSGVVFHITDSIMRGVLGVTCISPTFRDALTDLKSVLMFIQKQLDAQSLDNLKETNPFQNNIREMLEMVKNHL